MVRRRVGAAGLKPTPDRRPGVWEGWDQTGDPSRRRRELRPRVRLSPRWWLTDHNMNDRSGKAGRGHRGGGSSVGQDVRNGPVDHDVGQRARRGGRCRGGIDVDHRLVGSHDAQQAGEVSQLVVPGGGRSTCRRRLLLGRRALCERCGEALTRARPWGTSGSWSEPFLASRAERAPRSGSCHFEASDAVGWTGVAAGRACGYTQTRWHPTHRLEQQYVRCYRVRTTGNSQFVSYLGEEP